MFFLGWQFNHSTLVYIYVYGGINGVMVTVMYIYIYIYIYIYMGLRSQALQIVVAMAVNVILLQFLEIPSSPFYSKRRMQPFFQKYFIKFLCLPHFRRYSSISAAFLLLIVFRQLSKNNGQYGQIVRESHLENVSSIFLFIHEK